MQACKNFYDDGVCKQECPPMQIYNPIKYKWERDPLGKYAYGATCVKDCPEHLLKDNGACVRACPPKKKVKKKKVMIEKRVFCGQRGEMWDVVVGGWAISLTTFRGLRR